MKAIARGFAQAGEQVLALGVGDLPPPEANLSYTELDVQDGAAVVATISPHAVLSVAVNCVSIIRRKAEHEPELFQQVIDINLTGTMRVCSAARSRLTANSVVIINIASMLSYFGGGLVPGYAEDGIRVNALAPVWIMTPLTSSLRDNAERSKALLARTPMGRWSTPKDLISPALFLASAGAGLSPDPR